MKKRVLATALNWFLPGLGYIILGERILQSVFFIVGLVGLTWVEFGIKEAAAEYYMPMFISVLVMNTGFAIDAWLLGSEESA